ncbi:MAG: Flp family type IVb pilin [Kiloniellaceae bacterium]
MKKFWRGSVSCIWRRSFRRLAMFGRDRSGISSVEYALLLAFIGGGIVIAASTLSDSISDRMKDSANCIKGTSADCTP